MAQNFAPAEDTAQRHRHDIADCLMADDVAFTAGLYVRKLFHHRLAHFCDAL